MATLTRPDFARKASVSPQAIHKALKRGWLIAEADGTLDTERQENRTYLAQHANGIDVRTRDMRTHRGPGQSYLAEAYAVPRGGGGAFDLAAAERISDEFLAQEEKRGPLFSDAELAATLNRLEVELSPIDRQFLHKVDGLTTTLADVKAAIRRIEDRFDGVDALAGIANAVSGQLDETVKWFEQRVAAVSLPVPPSPVTGVAPARPGANPEGLLPPQRYYPSAPSPPTGYAPPPLGPSRFDQVEGKLDRVLAALEDEGEDSRAAFGKLRAFLEDELAGLPDLRPTLARLETGQFAQEHATREMTEATKDVRYHLRELLRVLIARAERG